MKPLVRAGSKHREANTGELIDPIWTRPNLLAARLVATNTIANTNSSVIQLAIPANTLAVGDIIEIAAHARFNSTAVASADTTAIALGTGTPASNPVVTSARYNNAATARTNMQAVFRGLLIVRAIGTSAAVMGQIYQERQVAPTVIPVANTLALTFNSTVANTISLNYISGNANASMAFEVATIKVNR